MRSTLAASSTVHVGRLMISLASCAVVSSAVAELKTKLDKGTYIKPTTCTLGEDALEWLPRRDRSDKGLKATTLSGYRRYIEADIGPLPWVE
jgi:hypothetical protein